MFGYCVLFSAIGSLAQAPTFSCQVEVNLLRARAQVSFREATAEQLVDAIETIGFDARDLAAVLGASLMCIFSMVSILSVTSATNCSRAAPNRRVELSVEGMTCAACSGAVERALRNSKGILDVQALDVDVHMLDLNTPHFPGHCEASIHEEYIDYRPFHGSVSLLRSKAVIRCTAEAPSAEALAEEVEDCGFEAKVISDALQFQASTCWDVHPWISGAEESDEAQVGQRLQPEIAKLHVKALGLAEAQEAMDRLEKMPGVLSVVAFQNLS
eukprot:Skav202478  [mRNA]  locus=scaffold149:739130:741422:+ [translate_table: standard]